MSTVGGGVNIVKDGLVMYLDASNTKSLADVPATNILLNSNAFENASWSTLNISVTANQAVSPSGLQDADLVDDGVVTNTQHWLYQNPTFLYNTTYTLSIFAKYISRKYMTINIYNGVTSQYVDYDILNGVVYGTTGDVTTSIQSYGNSWYRLSYTRTIAATGSPNFRISMADDFGSESYTGSNKQVYLYGAQFELGSVATTYIPTTTAAASRVPTWADISKGGNNGTLVNNPTYNYSNGGSLVFNGTTSYVNCGNILNYTSGNFSFSYWIYVNSLTTNQSGQGPIILFKGQYQVNGYYDQINTGGAIGFNTNTNGVIVGSGTGFGVILAGRTYNICYTRNGSSIRVYVNGVDVTTYSGTHLDPVSSSSNFLINSYNGSIFSNVRTYSFSNYNRALSASEVLQNYNVTKTRFGL